MKKKCFIFLTLILFSLLSAETFVFYVSGGEGKEVTLGDKTKRLKQVILEDMVNKGHAPGETKGKSLHKKIIYGSKTEETFETKFEFIFSINCYVPYNTEYEIKEGDIPPYKITYNMPDSRYLKIVNEILNNDSFETLENGLDELKGISSNTNDKITGIYDQMLDLNSKYKQLQTLIKAGTKIRESYPESKQLKELKITLDDIENKHSQQFAELTKIEQNLLDAINASEHRILEEFTKGQRTLFEKLFKLFLSHWIFFLIIIFLIIWLYLSIHHYRKYNEEKLSKQPLFFIKKNKNYPTIYLNTNKDEILDRTYLIGNYQNNPINIEIDNFLQREIAIYSDGGKWKCEVVNNDFLKREGLKTRKNGRTPHLTIEQNDSTYLIHYKEKIVFVLHCLNKKQLKREGIIFMKETFKYNKFKFVLKENIVFSENLRSFK